MWRRLRFEQLAILSVAVLLQVSRRNEAQGGAVDTVPQSRRSRPVGKDVTELAVRFLAADLGTRRKEAAIFNLNDVAGFERPDEARPPGTAIELVGRAEQGFAAHDVNVDPGLVVVPILVGKRRLRGTLLGNLVLRRRQ